MVRLEEWKGRMRSSQIHRLRLLTGQERGKGTHWGARHQVSDWGVWNDCGPFSQGGDQGAGGS